MKLFNKVSILFHKSYVTKLWKLTILIVIGMFFEIAGLGLILPTIYMISNPESLYKFNFFSSLLNILGNPSSDIIIILGMIILSLFYLAKMIYLTFLNWKQSNFSANF